MSYSKVEGIMQSMKSERIERIWSGDNRNELVDEALRRAVNFAHSWSEEDKSTESINIYMVTDYWLMSLGGYVAGWVDYSDYNNIYVNKEIWDSLSKIARAWLLRYLLNVRRHALKEAPSHRQIEVPQDLAAELRDIYNEKLFDLRKVNTEKAFEQFIKVNEGLIRYCIRAFRNYIRFLVPEALQNNQYGYEITGYSEKDIRQDVLEQMWRSFQGFDKGKRFTFSTYFVGVWKIIRGRVLLNYFITHMPKSEIHTINYIRAFRNKENRPPTLEELKEKYPKRAKGYLETCLRTEENLRNGLYKHTFVDAPLATEEFEEALESVGAAPLTRDDTQTLESYMYIQEIFEQCKLTPEEKFVLSLRNGIPVDEDLLSSLVLYEVSVIEPRSYYQDEIAPLLHLTRGRIQQIEAKAIKKIKHPAHKGLFERFGVSSPGPVEANMVGPMFRGNLPWLRQVVQNIGSKISRLIRDEFGGMKMGKDGEAEPPEDQVPSLGILRLDKLKEHLSLLIAVGKEDKRSPDKIAEDIVNDAELINVLSTYRALVELAVESTDSGDEFTKATANAAIRRFNQNPSKNLEASKQQFIDQMEELLVMLEKDIKDWRSGFRRRRISVRLGEIESEMHDMITCLAELEESELVDTLLDMYVKRLEKPLMKNFYREHFPCYVMLRAACRSKYYGYKLGQWKYSDLVKERGKETIDR